MDLLQLILLLHLEILIISLSHDFPVTAIAVFKIARMHQTLLPIRTLSFP